MSECVDHGPDCPASVHARRLEYEAAYGTPEQKAERGNWGDEDPQADRREARLANQRKMVVRGRSTLLLSALSSGQQARRRKVNRARKRGAR